MISLQGLLDLLLSLDLSIYPYRRGLIGMANSGNHTNTSQWFITLGEPSQRQNDTPKTCVDLKVNEREAGVADQLKLYFSLSLTS